MYCADSPLVGGRGVEAGLVAAVAAVAERGSSHADWSTLTGVDTVH